MEMLSTCLPDMPRIGRFTHSFSSGFNRIIREPRSLLFNVHGADTEARDKRDSWGLRPEPPSSDYNEIIVVMLIVAIS